MKRFLSSFIINWYYQIEWVGMEILARISWHFVTRKPTLSCSNLEKSVCTFSECHIFFRIYRRHHQTTGEARVAPPTSLTLARRSFVTITRTSQGQLRFRVHRGIQLSQRQRELRRWRAQTNWLHPLVHQDLHQQVRILMTLIFVERSCILGSIFLRLQ